MGILKTKNCVKCGATFIPDDLEPVCAECNSKNKHKEVKNGKTNPRKRNKGV